MKIKQFSKWMLLIDYVIAIGLLVAFLFLVIFGTLYNYLFDVSTLGIVLSAWIAQLGVSSTAYYIVIKSEHKIELPMKLINEMPDEIKQSVDMTTIITTVLTSTDN